MFRGGIRSLMDGVSFGEFRTYLKHKVIWEGGWKNEGIVGKISTDTRDIGVGDIFVALEGENWDGHDFIGEAVRKGAKGIVLDLRKSVMGMGLGVWVLGVRDTLEAYQEIAFGYLKRFRIIQVGITGTNGKTTTKEMARQILSRKYRVVATVGNENNQIGVPRTILRARGEDEVILLEMGAGKRGDIGRLARGLDLDYGVITNVSEAHLEFLGDMEGVIEEKRGILEGLRNGVLILDEGGKYYDRLSAGKEEVRGIRLGEEGVCVMGSEGCGYRLGVFGCEVKFGVWGGYNLMNLNYAVVLGKVLGVREEDMVGVVGGMGNMGLRGEVIEKGGYMVIQDCYNANPVSMREGLGAFGLMGGIRGSKVVVLGDMLELGVYGGGFHEVLGYYIAGISVDYILYLGEFRDQFYKGFKKIISSKKKIHLFKDDQNLIRYLNQLIKPGDWIYLKASRGLQFEKIISSL